jgi:hypothetical protein
MKINGPFHLIQLGRTDNTTLIRSQLPVASIRKVLDLKGYSIHSSFTNASLRYPPNFYQMDTLYDLIDFNDLFPNAREDGFNLRIAQSLFFDLQDVTDFLLRKLYRHHLGYAIGTEIPVIEDCLTYILRQNNKHLRSTNFVPTHRIYYQALTFNIAGKPKHNIEERFFNAIQLNCNNFPLYNLSFFNNRQPLDNVNFYLSVESFFDQKGLYALDDNPTIVYESIYRLSACWGNAAIRVEEL